MLFLRKNSGFTIIEIIVVIIVISIAAMLAVPMFSSAADMQTRSVANMITADIEYAKSLAVSTQNDYSVVFDPAGDSDHFVQFCDGKHGTGSLLVSSISAMGNQFLHVPIRAHSTGYYCSVFLSP